jgi:hypothetical protein
MDTLGYVLLAVVLVVTFVYISHRTWPKKNYFGIVPMPLCQRCGTPKPRFPFIKPTFKEYVTGGWRCRKCGAHLDKNGRPKEA